MDQRFQYLSHLSLSLKSISFLSLLTPFSLFKISQLLHKNLTTTSPQEPLSPLNSTPAASTPTAAGNPHNRRCRFERLCL
ncbi:hypothetical protein Hanom_Chr09g00781471 [Helianthus anomalus]